MSPPDLSAQRVDLTNCDREPIHIPGAIQPHGCLIAFDSGLGTALRHSANAASMLGLPDVIVGAPIDRLLGGHVTHALRNALATSSDPSRPALLFGLALPGAPNRAFDVAVHRYAQAAIVEFEPVNEQHGRPLEIARTLIGRIRRAGDREQLLRDAARLVRGILGYDRVMIYRFGHDGAGQVIGESKRDDLESFLGQYFPASDIPQQARTLYLRNTIRAIGDACFAPVPIQPALDDTGAPLDLSFAHLRSVSPIHCEYLRNMGVAASMSISIVVGGELWGLIACHHSEPRLVPMAQRVAVEMFGDFFSLQLDTLRQKQKLDSTARARQALDRFLRLATHHGDIRGLLRDNLPEFARLLACDGVGLWMDGAWSAEAATPPADAIPALAELAGRVGEGRVWSTHALARNLPGAEAYFAEASGALAIPLSQRPRDYLFFFRREVIQTLDWAGNPEKSYATGPLGDRLTPRKSFAIWKETVRMQARPWTEADRETAEAARAALVEVVLRQSEAIAEERSKADLRQRMLNEELNHRVKNILAVIQSLVGHPVAEGRVLEDYVASLKGRVRALAFAHDQIVRGDGGGRLLDLLNAELSPYREAGDAIRLDGPDLWLDARAFSVMALVLHELATNAAKYGALSATGGRLSVTWRLDEAGDCALVWRETGGPPTRQPAHEGFGTVLIGRSVPYDLGGESTLDYAAEGLIARFRLPGKHVAPTEDRPARARQPAARPPAAPDKAPDLGDLRVLLVEDQMLIAMDVESMLVGKGIARIVTSGSAADALKRLQTIVPDIAILDVNLGVGTSIPVAEELRRRRIPFVFATGYGDRSMIPRDFADIPVVRKPYDAEALIDTIRRALER